MLTTASPRGPLLAVASALGVLGLVGCGGGGDTSTSAALPRGCEAVQKPPPKHVHLKRPQQRVAAGAKLTASVDTSCGMFQIALDAAGSPKTVSSFVYLARKGVYDDTTFHRIVPGFVIQGGDPTGTGTGGPGYAVDEPPPPRTQYRRGAVAMAKTAVEPPGQSGSQFFIVTATDAGLPPQFAVLGRVSSGQDVVRRIASVGDPSSGQTGTPLATVVIRRITVRGG
jgi:peptidyl-prolyl cis-trans isomerase B (cyclophilin B)